MAERSVTWERMLRFCQAVIVVGVGACFSACAADRADALDFPTFWSSFRQAAIQEDYAALRSYSQLPVELRGVHDSQPAQDIGEEAFSEIMERVLTQPVFKTIDGTLTERPLKAVLEEKVSIDEDEWKGREIVRVTQFVFHKIDGEWLLVRVFLE